MNDPTSPKFVYRLASAEEWRLAQETGIVPLREIDRRDGYIHLSVREQVLETANRHFSGVNNLLALEIELAVIAEKVKFELAPKRGEAFPHLYGELRSADIGRKILLNIGDSGFTFGATQ